MADAVIHAARLGKRYRLGRVVRPHATLRESVTDGAVAAWRATAARLRGGGAARAGGPTDFWALRGVSFDVGRGEAVGLVGGNGAGKSTLLKLLSRITAPTEGRAEIRGRVGSLLEVGTGFHPELTGRENIFLNGAILGMRRAEVARKFDEMVAFAEVEPFLDTPVKRYSSGMYLRLAFAVAAHLEPEVLLVDEVLAVGDAAFQRKCLGKMHDVMELGRTVVFVSHNMAAVQHLCQRALWLRDGAIVDDGPAGHVVSRYLRAARASRTEQRWPEPDAAPGNEQVRLRRAAVVAAPAARDGDGASAAGEPGALTTRTPLRLELEYWSLRPDARLQPLLQLQNEEGLLVLEAAPPPSGWERAPMTPGLYRDVWEVPGDLLNDGSYRLQLVVLHEAATVVYRHDELLAFEVQPDALATGPWHGRRGGVVRPRLPWRTERLADGVAGDAGAVGPDAPR